MMREFIGTKVLLAEPMTKLEYCKYRGWLVPENEDPAEPGFLVEYTDGGKPNDSRHAGYISWSPSAQFHAAYRSTDGGMNFGQAIEAMRKGLPVARTGWNGKDMCVYIVPANSYPAQTPTARKLFGAAPVPYNAYFALKGADGAVSTWAPSGSDALAQDWLIVKL